MAAMDFHTYDNTLYEKVYQTAYQAAAELIETAGMKAGQILVVGCSTSEVGGEKIGTYSRSMLCRSQKQADPLQQRHGRHLLILWQWSILRHMQEWISEIR